MKKNIILLILLIISNCLILYGKENYKIVTENYPPFNYVEDGKLKGISTEIIDSILNKIGWDDTNIEVLPWSIAVSLAKHDPNTIIFSMSRNEEREKYFKWVGPIATNYWNLYSLKKIEGKEVKLDIHSRNDAKKFSIVTQKDGAFANFLENEGFTHLQYTNDTSGELDSLLNHQAQLMAASELPMYVILEQKNLPPDTVRQVIKIKTSELFIAFNKNIQDSVVNKFKTALKELKQSEEYDRIINKYYQKYLGE